MKHCGLCKKCGKWYKVPPEIDDSESNVAFCPTDGAPLYLTYKPLEIVTKQIALSKSEIGDGIATVRDNLS
jgi:hypothetical protein